MTGLNDLSVYFKEMSKLVEQKKISSRVRFLMQVSAKPVQLVSLYIDICRT